MESLSSDTSLRENPVQKLDPNILFDAVVHGEEAAVTHLVGLGISIDACDDQGMTALHWSAASPEGEALVPFLLSVGAKLESRDKVGHTPLHLHCAQGRLFGASCLLHHGGDANARTQKTLLTPLHLAADMQHVDITRLLLAYGARQDAKDGSGKRPKEVWVDT